MTSVALEPALPQVRATLDAPPDLMRLGARIETDVRAIVARWEPATYTDGEWHVSLDKPLQPGDYQLVWRTADPEPPDFEVFVPFTV